MRKVVIAPDSFKGSLSSLEAAQAAAAGVRAVFPGCETICLETADGGEGTASALTKALKGQMTEAIVSDPLGRKITAAYGIAEISGRKTAVMEMSQASGLTLLDPEERNPLLTSTYGTGEMILDALHKGCRRFLIGIGGSATNDAGTGMLEALGFSFFDKDGQKTTCLCGGLVSRISKIEPPAHMKELAESEFIVACDVETPFCGPEGAAAVFGPQKGATPETVVLLEAGMQSLNNVISRDFGTDLSEIKGSGAAGGLGGAFQAFLGASLQSGIDIVLEAIGFEEAIQGADLIITGEGKMDSQTARGKVISGITSTAQRHGIPVMAIAGIMDMTEKEIRDLGISAAYPICPRPEDRSGLEHAMRPETASKNITATVARALESLSPSSFRANL